LGHFFYSFFCYYVKNGSVGVCMRVSHLETKSRFEFIDITAQVERVVAEKQVDSGLCVVYVSHTTAAVTINENADPSVPSDISRKMEDIVPLRNGYDHMEGNSAAHIKSTLVGCSEIVPIEKGRLYLGTWQAIFFCEFDGPRRRQFGVKVISG